MWKGEELGDGLCDWNIRLSVFLSKQVNWNSFLKKSHLKPKASDRCGRSLTEVHPKLVGGSGEKKMLRSLQPDTDQLPVCTTAGALLWLRLFLLKEAGYQIQLFTI